MRISIKILSTSKLAAFALCHGANCHLCFVELSSIMLTVLILDSTKFHYAECFYTAYRNTFHYADCFYAACRNKFQYAECYADCRTILS